MCIRSPIQTPTKIRLLLSAKTRCLDTGPALVILCIDPDSDSNCTSNPSPGKGNLPLPLGFDHSDDYIGADTGPFPLNPLCSSGYHLRGSSWAWCPWNRGQTWRRTRCSYSAHVPTLEVWMLMGWRHSYGTGGTKGPTTWQVRARGLHCECRYRYGVLPSSVPRPCQQTVEMPAHRQVCIHIRIYIYTTMLIRARKYTHHARRNMSYPLASNNSYQRTRTRTRILALNSVYIRPRLLPGESGDSSNWPVHGWWKQQKIINTKSKK